MLPSIEELTIFGESLEKIIHRSTSLKTLELDMQHLINFKNFHFNLETVKSLRITVQDDEEADDAKLATLSQTIEQRMPKLEYVYLEFWCMDEDGSNQRDVLTFVLKSKSLKEAYIRKQVLLHHELDCPSLERGDSTSIIY